VDLGAGATDRVEVGGCGAIDRVVGGGSCGFVLGGAVIFTGGGFVVVAAGEACIRLSAKMSNGFPTCGAGPPINAFPTKVDALLLLTMAPVSPVSPLNTDDDDEEEEEELEPPQLELQLGERELVGLTPGRTMHK